MDSIEKLRKYVHDNTDNSIELTSYPPQHVTRCTREKLLELIDAIEAEVKKCYMELPLGFDGEPIHVGDVLRRVNDTDDSDDEVSVMAVSTGDVFYDYDGINKDEIYNLAEFAVFQGARADCFCRSNSLESILRDVLNDTCSIDQARERYWKYQSEKMVF